MSKKSWAELGRLHDKCAQTHEAAARKAGKRSMRRAFHDDAAFSHRRQATYCWANV